MNQAFSVPKNTSPNCSGHFKHFSHPHEKKEAASSWNALPGICMTNLVHAELLLLIVFVITHILYLHPLPAVLFPPKATCRAQSQDLKMLYKTREDVNLL